MNVYRLTLGMLAELPKTSATDPIEYYKRPLVGRLFLGRINRGLALLPAQRFSRALEVGYGSGAVLLALAGGVDEIHGIDLDADPVPVAKLLGARDKEADLRCSDVCELPYASEFFDLVVCFSVFEHLHAYRRALAEVYRVLRPGGLFLLGMPAVNRLMEAGFLAVGYKGIHHHHVTGPAEVVDALPECGFQRVDQSYLDFPLPVPLGVRLYHNWLSRKPVAGPC